MIRPLLDPRFMLALLCLHFAAVRASAQDGVPAPEEDYSQEVDAWWAAHPLNPMSETYSPEIDSPDPVITLNGQDLQASIDALPESGGSIRIPSGAYGGISLVGRKNIHLLADGEVTIRGSENLIIGSELNMDYGGFCTAVHRKDSEAVSVARGLPARNIYLKGITFDDSPVRLASCRGVLFDNCRFRKAENREVGDKDADGKKVLRWYRPLSVTGIMGLQHVWFRKCDFEGHYANAIYLDGAQFSGVLNCRFAGADRLWHNSILLFTNDDLSLDVDGDGELSPFERRDIRYFVAEGCSFGGGYKRGAIAASGRDILIQNCRVDGPLESLLVVNAKTSGKEIYYESFGVKALYNTLDQVSYIVTAEGAANRPEKGLPDWWVWTKYEIGRFEIRNNRVTGLKKPLHEIPKDSEILGPHQIEENGADAPGANPRPGS